MAVITPGYTFTGAEAPPGVTHTHLNNAIGSATVTQIAQGDWASTVQPVIVSVGSPAGANVGQLWWDTTNNLLRMYTGNNWLAIAGARGQRESQFMFTVGGIATLAIGMAGVISTAAVGRITTSMTIAHGFRFVGVATQAYTDGQLARLCHQGYCQVLMDSVSSAGHVLYLSDGTEGRFKAQDPLAPTAGRPYLGVLWEGSTVGNLAWAWIWGGPRVLA